MQFGVMFANVGAFATPEGAVAMGRAAEGAGFDSVWTVEHVLVPEGYESEYPYDPSGRMPLAESIDLPDPLVWLTWVAAHTERLKVGTGILIVPQRPAAVTAKEAATLHLLSGGRLLLGVGAGWLAEEFAALGVPFERRGKRLEAYIGAMRALWGEGPATVHDEFVDLERAISLPKPPGGAVPIVIGGHTEVAARRAGRIGDGFFPGRGKPERLAELIAIMRRTAEEAGRDPDAIEITAGSNDVLGGDPVPVVEELRDLGVDRVVIPPLSFDPAALEDAFGAFAQDVIAKV
jgi:probable F420-dependent oxidoreductase